MDGQRLRRLREDAGLTQVELATATGIPQRTISNYEHHLLGGKRPRVSRLYAKSLADHFGVTVRYLMGETDNPEDDGNEDSGKRTKTQLAEIVDALPVALHPALVELGRGLLRLAQETERTHQGTDARTQPER